MKEKGGVSKARYSWALQIPSWRVFDWAQGAQRLDSSWLLGAGPLGWALPVGRGQGLVSPGPSPPVNSGRYILHV